jgi:hypothetical protein
VELTRGEEERVEGLLGDLVGSRKSEVLDLLDRFERSHPTGQDHY